MNNKNKTIESWLSHNQITVNTLSKYHMDHAVDIYPTSINGYSDQYLSKFICLWCNNLKIHCNMQIVTRYHQHYHPDINKWIAWSRHNPQERISLFLPRMDGMMVGTWLVAMPTDESHNESNSIWNRPVTRKKVLDLLSNVNLLGMGSIWISHHCFLHVFQSLCNNSVIK